jgi:hypothetical protein
MSRSTVPGTILVCLLLPFLSLVHSIPGPQIPAIEVKILVERILHQQSFPVIRMDDPQQRTETRKIVRVVVALVKIAQAAEVCFLQNERY